MNGETDHALAYEDFVRARQRYWKQRAGRIAAQVEAPELQGAELTNDDGGLMLYSSGPKCMVAVFEEAGHAGWFYLYDAGQGSIVRAAHIYNGADVVVEDDVVDIGWAADDSACGLALWGQFRAFLGVSSELAVRRRVIDADDDGIPAIEWPSGFEHYLEKKIE